MENFWTSTAKNGPGSARCWRWLLGGGSLLAGRKKQTNLRALAVMNSMTMAAHQVEEYVEPGWFPGMVNKGLFKSDNPRSWPYNPNSAMCANASFTAIYMPPMLFPKVKWLVLPPALLGIGHAFAHGLLMPILLRTRYTPGTLTAVLLHVPIAITYIQALRRRKDCSSAVTGSKPSASSLPSWFSAW